MRLCWLCYNEKQSRVRFFLTLNWKGIVFPTNCHPRLFTVRRARLPPTLRYDGVWKRECHHGLWTLLFSRAPHPTELFLSGSLKEWSSSWPIILLWEMMFYFKNARNCKTAFYLFRIAHSAGLILFWRITPSCSTTLETLSTGAQSFISCGCHVVVRREFKLG